MTSRVLAVVVLAISVCLGGCKSSQSDQPAEAGGDPPPAEYIRHVTFRCQDQPLSEVLEAIEAQTDVTLNVDLSDEEADALLVTVDFQDVPFWQAMLTLSEQTGLGLNAPIAIIASMEAPTIAVNFVKDQPVFQQSALDGPVLMGLRCPMPMPDDEDQPGFALSLLFLADECSPSMPTTVTLTLADGSHRQLTWSDWENTDTFHFKTPADLVGQTVTISGEVKYDAKSGPIPFDLPIEQGATATKRGVTMTLTNVQRTNTNIPRLNVEFTGEWDTGLSDEDVAAVDQLRADAKDRPLTQDERTWLTSIKDRSRRMSLATFQAFDEQGDEIFMHGYSSVDQIVRLSGSFRIAGDTSLNATRVHFEASPLSQSSHTLRFSFETVLQDID